MHTVKQHPTVSKALDMLLLFYGTPCQIILEQKIVLGILKD